MGKGKRWSGGALHRSRLGSVVFRRGKCYTRVCVRRDMPKEGARCVN